LQLIEGLWSLYVELGVSHTGAPVIAFSGQYRLAGDTLVVMHHRGLSTEKKQKGRGLGVNVSDTSK
jgi:hypothetical protein